MKSKKIAGVSINLDAKDRLDYDVLVKMACNTVEYKDKPNKVKLIQAELKKHGISKPSTRKSKASKSGPKD